MRHLSVMMLPFLVVSTESLLFSGSRNDEDDDSVYIHLMTGH